VRRTLALIAAAAGLLAAFTDYRPPTTDYRLIASAIAREEDHVTALELAQWIRDRKPSLRILDLRSADEFDTYHVPRSERAAIESLPSTQFGAHETIVLISGGGAHAAQGWVLLRARGVRNVFFLRGGVDEWLADVMSPAKSSELTEYFGGVPRGDRPAADAAAVRRRGC
jgi:rhodanese-related sulfurtransferase